MLRKTFISGLAIVLFCWTALLAHLLIVRKDDYKEYQALLKEKGNKREKNSLVDPIKQLRQEVRKDIWYYSDDMRLHFRLHSENSELTLKIIDNKPIVVENLKNMECWVQDKLYFDHAGKEMQQLRYFTADSGIYLFPTHRFFAEKVYLSFFKALGHDLPILLFSEDSFLDGYAKEATFFLGEKNPVFSAQHLKAKIKPQ